MTDFEYEGSELEVFANATCWKAYIRRLVAPWYGDAVLEVGAGFGGTTSALRPDGVGRWACLEPDGVMAEQLAESIARGELPPVCEAMHGSLADLPAVPSFDSILYMDVLEHIEDDVEEVREAFRRLRPGGRLVVLSPAHSWLYTPFDAAIGHFRRYTAGSLRSILPPGARILRLDYLDSVGLVASLANRLFLRSDHPTPAQIRFWDRVLVRMSQVLDPAFAHRLGKSVLLICTPA